METLYLGIGTIAVALAAVLISVVSLVQSGRIAKRESYSAARNILGDLISGDVAHARSVTGKVRYGDGESWKALDYGDIIDQYFMLEWALERAAYGVKGLKPSQHEVQDSLRDAIRRHIKELFTTVQLFHAAFDNDEVQDGDSWAQAQMVVSGLNLDDVPTDEAEPDQAQVQAVCDRLAELKRKPKPASSA